MSKGEFEVKYDSIMSKIENKLKTDSRMLELSPWFTIVRGAPADEPIGEPVLFIAEGRISDLIWDTSNAVMTIEVALVYFVKHHGKEEGVRDIRERTLRLFDVLCGTISDRRLEIDGVSYATGEGGVKVVNADFGHFSPDSDSIIYRGVMEVNIEVEVPLVDNPSLVGTTPGIGGDYMGGFGVGGG